MAAPVDPEQLGFVGRVIAGAAGIVTVGWGVFTFKKSREDKAQAKEEKAEEERLAAVNERITRHRQLNEDQVKAHHTAILDLYSKHEKTRDSVETLRTDTAKGFQDLTSTLHGIHADILKEMRK